MNIFSRSFFILSFLLISSSSSGLYGMNKGNNDYTAKLIKKPSSKTAEDGILEYKKKRLVLFNSPWVKAMYKIHCKNADKNKKYKMEPVGKAFDINNFEFCKKTKALVSGLFIGAIFGTVVSTAYYFNWFKKK